MKPKNRSDRIVGAIVMLLGLCCALVLGVLFYGAMAYQLADGAAQKEQALPPQEAGALLALSDAELLEERTEIRTAGGQECLVTTRVYALEGGRRAEAISASPAAYIEILSEESYAAQLITGFTLAGFDAVYALSGGRCALYARDGECAYLLFAPADEQAAYALGAAAYLEE